MFKLKDLKSEKLKRSTSRIILYAILDKASFEEKSSVKIGQTYLSENYCISTKTVGKELKYLQEQGYITYKRSLYNNLTTTEITLTDKSIAILNAEASKPQNKPQNKAIKTEETQPQADVHKTENKPQNKPINTEASQPQAETKKTQGTAPKQVETEQAEITLTPVQRGCLIALERAVKRGGSYPEIYVEDALQQGVPNELINNILRERFKDGIR